MKKCPQCEKTFDDNMKFCQSDGTSLVADQDTPAVPEDPYKTTVGNVADLPIPPKKDEDLMKTMVAGSVEEVEEAKSEAKVEEEPLLEVAEEEFDPMQTMVAGDMPKFDRSKPSEKEEPKVEPKVEAKDKVPAVPSGVDSASKPGQSEKDQPALSPELPNFSEPNISPPNLADSSSHLSLSTDDKVEEKPSSPAEKVDVESGADDKKDSAEKPDATAQKTTEYNAPKTSDGSDFGRKGGTPIPSPFDLSMPPGTPPPTPMPHYKESDAKSDALNSPFSNKSANAGWNPPPSPMGNIQNQGLDQNFVSPNLATSSGENNTLGIVSLVCGILSTFCILAFVAGIPAIITGYLARKRIAESPSEYGGGTLALIGMILGVIGTIFVTGAGILIFLFSILPNL